MRLRDWLAIVGVLLWCFGMATAAATLILRLVEGPGIDLVIGGLALAAAGTTGLLYATGYLNKERSSSERES